MPKPGGKRGGPEKGGGKGGPAVLDPEPELDAEGNPIDADPNPEPELDDEGNPIEKEADPEPELDAEGNPIEKDPEPELDDEGNPIEADPEPDPDEDDPRDATIAELKARLETLEKDKTEKASAPKELSEEDWKKLEDQWGIAEKDGIPGNFGRKGIQQIVRLIGGMSQSFREMLNSELGGFKKEAAIAELAREKGSEDIKGYRKGIEEFLKDFDPRIHADKNILKKALTYARGLSASGKFKKALNSREKARKINASPGHGKPGGGKPAGGKSVALSAEQKAAAKQAKMSEAEYIKYLTTDNLEDIDLPE